MLSISFKHSPFFFYGLWFKSHLIRHLGMGRAFKDTQTFKALLLGNLGTRRALREHSEVVGYLGTWRAIEHSEGTWELRGHSGTLKALGHSGT